MNDLQVLNDLLTSGNPVSVALGVGLIIVSGFLLLVALCAMGGR